MNHSNNWNSGAIAKQVSEFVHFDLIVACGCVLQCGGAAVYQLINVLVGNGKCEVGYGSCCFFFVLQIEQVLVLIFKKKYFWRVVGAVKIFLFYFLI